MNFLKTSLLSGLLALGVSQQAYCSDDIIEYIEDVDSRTLVTSQPDSELFWQGIADNHNSMLSNLNLQDILNLRETCVYFGNKLLIQVNANDVLDPNSSIPKNWVVDINVSSDNLQDLLDMGLGHFPLLKTMECSSSSIQYSHEVDLSGVQGLSFPVDSMLRWGPGTTVILFDDTEITGNVGPNLPQGLIGLSLIGVQSVETDSLVPYIPNLQRLAMEGSAAFSKEFTWEFILNLNGAIMGSVASSVQ
ncbi:MAG: hypothetical protein GY915_07060 [bacterium]|nr:hypothetical protein [bacterium]